MAPASGAAAAKPGYNERLFSGGLRGRYHQQRFGWLTGAMLERGLRTPRVIELGCFDAKTLDHFDRAGIAPTRYLGLDANWEGGLELGQARWGTRAGVELQECHVPADIAEPAEKWDVAIAMETFEHIPPDLVAPYLRRLAEVVDGWLFIVSPVERGLPFLARHLPKKALGRDGYSYGAADVVNAVRGRTDLLPRNEHLGFDDRVLAGQVSAHFDVVAFDGVFPGLPIRGLNFQTGLVARTR